MRIALILPLILMHVFLQAQESYSGLSSNYTPTNSVLINPSSMLDAKTRIDINLVSVGAYLMNNLVYLPKNSLPTYLNEKQYENPQDFDLRLNRNKYRMYARAVAQAPGFVFSQGDHAFGLGLGAKSYTYLSNVPGKVITGLATRTIPDDPTVHAKKVSLMTMTYGDVKLSYAYTFLKKKRELFMGGISVSKFIPLQAGGSKMKQLNAEVLNDSTGFVFDMDADVANLVTKQATFFSGFGLDLGFTYQRMKAESFNYYPNSKRNNCRKNYYLYKIGVSIMDIGSLKFKQDELQYYGLKAENYEWEREEFSTDNLNVFEQIQNQEIGTEDQNEAFIKKLTTFRLPSYISVQGDYNMWHDRWYLNLSIVQRIPQPLRRLGVSRANSIALTPRFETKFFEFAMPFSLYDYYKPQLGIFFRFWFLSIGTDKIIDLVFDTDTYGADIYFALKIPIVYHPDCRDGRRDRLNYYPKRYRWRSKSCNGM